MIGTADAIMEETIPTNLGPKEDFTDPSSRAKTALHILKRLIGNLFAQAIRGGDKLADTLLLHCHRWLRTRSSLMYDGALVRLIHSMMHKMFLQLVHAVRGAGGRVIHATFSTLIVATDKMTLSGAYTFGQYLQKAIKADAMFKAIELEPRRVWNHLLWLDEHNHAGMPFSVDLSQNTATDGSWGQPPEEWNPNTKPEMMSHWHIASVLPKVAEHLFKLLTTEFIFKPLESALLDGAKSIEHSQNSQNHALKPAHVITACRKLLETRITDHVFSAVSQIHRQHPEDAPLVVGGVKLIRDPARTFAVYLMHVFGLDGDQTETVTNIAHQVLRQAGVAEYSDEARFKSPTQSIVLLDVPCAYCNFCRDIDVCREATPSGEVEGGFEEWVCTQCMQPYGRHLIEALLVDKLQHTCASWQTQDLKCRKCARIVSTNASEYCSCANALDCVIQEDEMRTLVRTYSSVAELFRLPWLQETAQWYSSLGFGDALELQI
eukprot:c19473_g1_i3.p1 GENE.c19473_g1_i3~~c19473_g1_i3.p1  ORF type:complete len:506 (+),score=117.54 c19473_g1_i3:47-1519(+)